MPQLQILQKTKKAVLSQRWPRNAPHIWVSWKFSGLPDYEQGYFSQIFSWAFVLIHPMNVRTKFKVRSFTRSWNIKRYPKNWAIPGYAHAPSSQKFLMGFSSEHPRNVLVKLEVHSFIRSWVNRGTPKLGRSLAMPTQGEAVWGRGWYRSKERWWVHKRPAVVTFPLFLRVSDILLLLFSSTTLFLTPPLVSPKFSHVPLRVWIAFWLQRVKVLR